MSSTESLCCKQIIDFALSEDINKFGDITSACIIDKDKSVDFCIKTREEIVVCIEPVAKVIFENFKVGYQFLKKDGQIAEKDSVLITGKGNALKVLQLERVLLNFIQHTCGVATITKKFVDSISHTNAKIRDTRKTLPGMRNLQKYAVKVGGGKSYRSSLSDKILIKDNHIAICGGIKKAMESVKNKLPGSYIAIECDKINQVNDAIIANVDMILLDNMEPEEIKDCVKLKEKNRSAVKLEASGGVNFENVVKIAETGVNYISVGMLTHSVAGKDIGMDIE